MIMQSIIFTRAATYRQSIYYKAHTSSLVKVLFKCMACSNGVTLLWIANAAAKITYFIAKSCSVNCFIVDSIKYHLFAFSK